MATATLSGSGALVMSASVPAINQTCSLAGGGSLSSVPWAPVALSGSGTLVSAASNPALVRTAQLGAVGTLYQVLHTTVSGSTAMGGTGTLRTPGAVGSHVGVSAPLLTGSGTLGARGRVIVPFRAPSVLTYTREAVPLVVVE